jgi:hypothetical protein
VVVRSIWEPDRLEKGRSTAHIGGMETTVDRVLLVIVGVGLAALAAVTVGYVAHYDFGLSRQEIRTPALVGVVVIGALLAVEHFGQKFRKFK